LNISRMTKTVYVSGCFLTDGTYIPGSYRSAPGINPIK
jgi:hypothetical protein